MCQNSPSDTIIQPLGILAVVIAALAACRMTAQQIADVLDVDLNRLKENREAMTDFYAAIRKGRAKGEAELRAALFKILAP